MMVCWNDINQLNLLVQQSIHGAKIISDAMIVNLKSFC